MTLTVGSLFSGIGGLDLGLERAGMSVRWQSEVDPFCCKVLAKHWPDVPNLGNVTKVDWNAALPDLQVDLICGGFPCQPFSVAGARRGRDDPRHLWPHFADALRVLRPRYAILENVPGIFALGFGEVAGDLADLGYDFEWDCIPAAAVGAPHLRYRVFVVAYSRSVEHKSDCVAVGRKTSTELSAYANRESAPGVPVDAFTGRGELVPDTDQERRVGRSGVFGPGRGRQPTDCGWWSPEPNIRRVAHGIPRRVDRLRSLGNAVVPQVAEWIGARLLDSISEGTVNP